MDMPKKLSDGDYIARCRQATLISATVNGHSQVFPQAHMTVKDGYATFFKDGKEVWGCNAVYAAAHFDVDVIQR
ncbi:hypothetical protein KBJ94_23630 [Pseudomonas sp. ITA]|uniref:hypothetical protein n=1 Tax=Pseudomonas sp. ITA TaxID=2825841 RepID=UPI002496BD53|nr:hypothetical protein [Pseudomonas sp. ITA]MDI2145042.1 hypothetical protein [Pseudomonas sp. ITA]